VLIPSFIFFILATYYLIGKDTYLKKLG
jgi:hypothetical protein